MRARSLTAVIGAVAVTAGMAAWRVVPAASGSERLGSRDVADVVALIHHDQEGIVLAHQAEAQSPAAATRRRAASLADGFRKQARVATAVLDAHAVPNGARMVDTTQLRVADDDAVGCDLMPEDAVSKLAATPPDQFDRRFSTLMGRHLVGGVGMAAAVLDDAGLGAEHVAALRRSQGDLG